jgi:hypothetical protein
MENLASICGTLFLSLLTRWPIKTRMELHDRHRPRFSARQGDAIPVERRAKYTESVRSVLKQLDEPLVNRASAGAIILLRSESMALRRAHESRWWRIGGAGEGTWLLASRPGAVSFDASNVAPKQNRRLLASRRSITLAETWLVTPRAWR